MTSEAEQKADNNETMRFQTFGHTVCFLTALVMAYAIYPIGNIKVSTFVINFIHLTAFAMLYGIQFWTIFVSGIVLMRSLPRHMFGKAQQGLFPVYFSLSALMTAVTIATFLAAHPYNTWSSGELFEMLGLCATLVCLLANALYLEPIVTRSMQRVFAVERKYGVGMTLGPKDVEAEAAMKKDPDYIVQRKDFVKLHGVSSLTNLIAFGGTTFHLFCLATHLDSV